MKNGTFGGKTRRADMTDIVTGETSVNFQAKANYPRNVLCEDARMLLAA